MNANVGLTDAADPADPNQHTEVDLNSSNYTYQNESNQSLSKAMATVGEGNVTVGGEGAELADLNRDAETTTNEIYDVDRQQGNIDLTVDHRLLSEEGRAQIAEDVETTAEKVSDIASTIGEGVEEFTDALGITNLSDDDRLELAAQINEALPSDLEALQLASAEIEEQTKEQQLTTMASNIFGDEVDPDATVQVTSQTGEVISISYREVMIDFMDRGVDALHSFVDTVNDDSIQHVENQDVLIAAKNAAENYLATYNENKPLYDALENFASAPLIAKMVTEGVTDVAQATGILEKTAQTAGDLQGAAIASLQKLKAGFNKLTGSGAAKAADDKVDDVASNADLIAKDVKTDTTALDIGAPFEGGLKNKGDVVGAVDGEFGYQHSSSPISSNLELNGYLSNNQIELNDGWNADRLFDEVLSAPKGSRPDPSEYMSQQQINEHLSLFDSGVVKIKAYAPEGTEGPPGGTFVMPKTFADKLIADSGGEISKLEKFLGLNAGELGSNPVRVDISSPTGLRVPNGNELGTNSQWIPGGLTNGGTPEATIDPVPKGNYKVSDIFGG